MAGTKQLTGTHLEAALKMLQTIASLMDGRGIRYSLDAGTLLGIMRENRLLPWDTDLDLAITVQDWPALKGLRRAIHKAGYLTRIRKTTRQVGPIPANSPRLLRVYTRRYRFFKDEQLMDIFIKYPVGDEFYWTVDSRNPIIQSCSAVHLNQLSRHHFEGYDYWIPSDFEGYLTHHYGDWITVRKDWNFRKEDGCNVKGAAGPVR